MGPQWFFEGLAVVGSGQFDDGLHYTTAAEALKAVATSPRPSSTGVLAAAVRYFSTCHRIADLVTWPARRTRRAAKLAIEVTLTRSMRV